MVIKPLNKAFLQLIVALTQQKSQGILHGHFGKVWGCKSSCFVRTDLILAWTILCLLNNAQFKWIMGTKIKFMLLSIDSDIALILWTITALSAGRICLMKSVCFFTGSILIGNQIPVNYNQSFKLKLQKQEVQWLSLKQQLQKQLV